MGSKLGNHAKAMTKILIPVTASDLRSKHLWLPKLHGRRPPPQRWPQTAAIACCHVFNPLRCLISAPETPSQQVASFRYLDLSDSHLPWLYAAMLEVTMGPSTDCPRCRHQGTKEVDRRQLPLLEATDKRLRWMWFI